MPVRLDTRSADFKERFAALLAVKREAAQDVEQAVRGIIDEVAKGGDRALLALTQKFDRVDLAGIGLRVSAADIATAVKTSPPGALDALKLARDRIEAYHRRQIPTDDRYTDALGRRTRRPLDRRSRRSASTCPGGTAAYPSLGADERRARPRSPASTRIVMVRAGARRRAQPAGAGRRRSRRRRRDLPRRRRPGGRRAGLRHRDDPRRSTRSSAPATPMSPPPSARSSARSAST